MGGDIHLFCDILVIMTRRTKKKAAPKTRMDLYHEAHEKGECTRPYDRKKAPGSCPKMGFRYIGICAKPFQRKSGPKKGKWKNPCAYGTKKKK